MNTGGPETRLIDDRFELLERLGGGGMGLVWRARDTMLHREVALKEVRPPDPAMAAADPAGALELRERVLREARALARLQHPNVAVIHHIVDTPGHPHPWLVMELVSGGSLADRIGRGPLSVPEAARIGRGVLAALRAAHAAGIQHRDVKPGNVLLRPDGTPVLTDFGIAAVQDSTALTATGALIGSPEYIAPERIRGEEGNPSSDLWSLGMMLYVAVEGHHPLRRATTLATLAAVLDEPLPPATRSGALGPVLAGLLARDPGLRPDADQLDRAFAAAEQGAGLGVGHGPGPVLSAPTAGWAPTHMDTPHPSAGGPLPTGPAVAGTDATGFAVNGFGVDGSGTNGSGTGGSGTNGFGTDGSGTDGFGTGGLHRRDFATTGSHPGPTSTHYLGGTTRAGLSTTAPERPARRRTGAAVTVAVVGVALAGVLAWSLRPHGNTVGGSNTTPSASGVPGASPTSTGSAAPVDPPPAATTPAAPTTKQTAKNTPAPKDLMTPDGVRTVVAAVTAQSGSTKVKQLTVYPNYASAQVPTADGRGYDWIDYRDGATTRRVGGSMGKDKPVDLAQYDWDVIPALLKKADESLNVKNPTSRYLIIDAWSSDGVASIRVYLSDAYSNGGYLLADSKGNVRRAYAAD
ncbi:serine/threonine-protein kinase [Kitasatospora sp. NPDC058201]|uniref:serine/threonine-protein kinase n=1 Tax=unclassified Kitasatospora TaxID=2633591 RepID=UPI00364D0D08